MQNCQGQYASKPGAATSETYKLKMATFENGQPEYFLMLLKNVKTAIDRTQTSLDVERINHLRTMLRVEALR